MIRIFNSITKSEIHIDESLDWIQVMPMFYMEPSHIKIEMKEFYFANHSSSCEDCNSFIKSFGKDTNEWFIEYNSKKYKIDTNSIGSKEYGSNEIKQSISDYQNGTVFTLSVIELNVEELNKLLSNAVYEEDYHKACVYRDLIKEIKTNV